jgi:hypothetical protein
MDVSRNPNITQKSAEGNEVASSPQTSLSEEERRARVEELIAAFGTIDFDPDYDYKEARRRDTLKLEKLYAELDQDISYEELEARWNLLFEPPQENADEGQLPS